MSFLKNIIKINNSYRLIMAISLLMMLLCTEVFGQEPPPRPVEVTVNQHLALGAFSHGLSGGTVIVDPAGSRTSTGDVILLNLGFTVNAASYRLVANQGTLINIMNGPNILLTGSSGGTMELHLGDTSPISPFVINTVPPNYTIMYLGATLSVGSAGANPPGAYSGTFEIIFIQE
jgi:hypothetical protein